MRRVKIALIVAIAATVAGASAASANAAKPQLWITSGGVIGWPGPGPQSLTHGEVEEPIVYGAQNLGCQTEGFEMRLATNGQSTDTFTMVGDLKGGVVCEPAGSDISGVLQALQVSVTGKVVAKFSPKLTITETILRNEGQKCVYTASKLEATIAIPGELNFGLFGTAKRANKLSNPSCAATAQVRLLQVWLAAAFNNEPWYARTIE